jgi:hypothetical protein
MGMTLVIGVAGISGAAPRHHDSGRGHHLFQTEIRGVVSAVSATSITVQRSKITESTLTISPTTTVFEGSTAASAAALATGERVDIHRTESAPTVAAKIIIQVATIAGTVSAVSGNVITVTGGEGFSRTINVSSATTFSEGGAVVTLSAVIAGSKIKTQGLVDSNGTSLDAISVVIAAPKDV